MGRKLSQASTKITKKNDHNKQQQQQQQHLNTLIKVLRPKVYITDSSSFKSLVQELTGNGDYASYTSTTPLVSSPPVVDHLVTGLPAPVIEIDDDIITTIGGYGNCCYNNQQQVAGSPDFSSLDSSELSVPLTVNSLSGDPSLDYYCSPEELGIHHHHHQQQQQQQQQQTTTTTMFNELDSSMTNDSGYKMDHLLQYRNVESWLLEMDPFVNSNYEEHGYVVPLNGSSEACMYDYELLSRMIA